MAETTYKHWLGKQKKSELIDLIYQLHIEHIELQRKHIELQSVLSEKHEEVNEY